MSEIGRSEAILEQLRVVGTAEETLPAPSLWSLHPRARHLAAIGAAVALGASPGTYEGLVEKALAAGASEGEVIGVLLAVAPEVGAARTVTASSRLALALGYDIQRALE